MSGKSLGSDQENIYKKVKYPLSLSLLLALSLSLEIWIFRNGQPDCDDRIIVVAMTPT